MKALSRECLSDPRHKSKTDTSRSDTVLCQMQPARASLRFKTGNNMLHVV